MIRRIGPDTSIADVEFRGGKHWIGCYILHGTTGLALVDPGPTSTLATLEAKLSSESMTIDDVTHLLLTHIHLDHAGATGTLIARNPRIKVWVHEDGARHLIDPQRLLRSARRIYGDQMNMLWGEFLPVPPDNIQELRGGESCSAAGRRLEVAYTPGHASHHVAYLDCSAGDAFVGDTTGVRIEERAFVLPVAPPPDIDVDGWRVSMRHLRLWKPSRLCPTHFGPAEQADDHLDEHEERLLRWAERVKREVTAIDDGPTLASEAKTAGETMSERFAQDVVQKLEHDIGIEEAALYCQGGGLRDSWHGLARYWRKRADR